MTELILSLRERELERFPIVAMRTAIGRDPGCDVVIDNVGISRLHATIEVIGDSFVLRDCDSENGLTLNGEACREGRLVHGDVIGLNKFLLRFSNQALEVPANLQPAEKAHGDAPKDVERTMHVDAEAAQAFKDLAKQQIARQRAEFAARGGESLPPLSESKPPPPRQSLRWEESASPGLSMPVLLGGLIVGGVLIAALLWVVR